MEPQETCRAAGYCSADPFDVMVQKGGRTIIRGTSRSDKRVVEWWAGKQSGLASPRWEQHHVVAVVVAGGGTAAAAAAGCVPPVSFDGV